ncbi:YitT family protein [Vibrio crassostreae]|uniref:YitT family protein n=1 Tax=Vibrio crassostreae TaxID=246167 RepID=UPI0010525FA1|nr:YitT family protein [Vibrio crassostreae]TCN93309.1 putative 5xTM membrane YitT family protein [Vibrio crassostreae]CAK1909007.1 putative 5xTM membrane YitT family protein [Vibrio crassostreae]CAK1909715.1 putative 5xTM membrane YitT family protein [Vibrio crassostreae]CAK1919395.1 putative 5xTM membrane YitT family protein [Vibrio crassostreae]CAK2680853.1 putative 5xTM membrane YitT family protein [Vibrio crassostreae]
MDKDHNLRENLLALILGSALVSLGVIFFNQVGLLTGGTAGLAIFITKVTDLSFGQVFFALNLPFYILSVARMGWRFTINTFIAVSIVSFAVDHLYHVIQIAKIHALYAALLGGGLIGTGMLVIFRHKMSLGGFNILALFLQERFGIRAGKVQMALDCTIVVLSLFIVDVLLVLLSVLGAIVTNLILAMNHKPGRYQPVVKAEAA